MIFALALACKSPDDTDVRDSDPVDTEVPDTDDGEVDGLIDAFVQSQMQAARVPGLAVAVVQDGEVRWARAYGWANVEDQRPVTLDTPFMLASISKTFIATRVMQEVEAGNLDLDADIDAYLPFAVDHPEFADQPITLRQLVTHTSGIHDRWPVWDELYSEGDSDIALRTFLEGYLVEGGEYDGATNWSHHAPGETYEYSNVGAALAAYVVEAQSGEDFAVGCDRAIFEPLGMQNTGWHLADFEDTSVIAMPYAADGVEFVPYGHYGYPDYPDGALRASVLDLGAFLVAYADGGAPLLDPGTVDVIWSEQTEAIPDQGIIWYRWNGPTGQVWGHSGSDSGVATEMSYRPEDGIGVILLMNADWYDESAVEALNAFFYAAAESGSL